MPWSRRRVGREVLARLKRLAVLVALELIVAATGLVQAQARTLSAHAAEMSGFGRLALEFDQPTKVKTKLANGILVIAFSAPVSIAGERLVREAPAYLAQVRQDPDGTGLRVALTQPYRVNVLEAGEKVFIDLLPASWTGLPPGLPPDVVEALARRAQEAQAKAREEERRRVQRAVRLKVVHLPTLVRLVVEVPASVPVAFASAGGVAELDINAFARLEAGDARTQAGEAVREISADASTKSLKIKLALGDRYEAKGFRDEDAFLIDLAKPAPPIGPPQPGGSAAADVGRLEASGRASEVELRKPAAPSPTL